jgi:hypothetical protein
MTVLRFQPSHYSQPRRRNPASGGGYTISDVPGVLLKRSGIKLNDKQKTFLRALRPLLSFDPMVTSGIRTVDEQASAMWNNFNERGYAYMDRLYAADVSPLKTAKSVNDVRVMIQNLLNRGIYLSDHMKGEAIDFRVNDLSAAQKSQLMNSIKSLGLEFLDEADHFHVEGVGGLRAQAAQAYQSVQQGTQTVTQAAGSLYEPAKETLEEYYAKFKYKAKQIPLSYYVISGVLIGLAGLGVTYVVYRRRRQRKRA